ncbi:hypothetical protein M422DRAFT_261890 [Sphaerobolus stellatus SS14]|uniref:Uncharacterized protein n=1 Tax=Sphaerobolus stellatus (strain SS14) TaxID=990650 RepID=A0A0C9UFQ2_SPHS4|nr:hypothetical protein M422DRAFT_270917 [Sphaerobolus stellatus SS14]KIJ35709.1 hypothetical protein M422DRAFT_261890 [Sphaerobolus stellatus SS14]
MGLPCYLFQKLCDLAHAPSIRKLEVSFGYGASFDDVRATYKFIVSLGPSLEVLLFIDNKELTNTLGDETDLSQHSSLRSISFELPWYDGFPEQQGTNHICKILSQISSPLRMVKLIIYPGSPNSSDELNILNLPAIGTPFFDKQHYLCRDSVNLTLDFGSKVDRTIVTAVKDILRTPDAEGRLFIK